MSSARQAASPARSVRTRVLITGSYGQGNTGDEAILRGILGSLRAARPDLEFQVVSGQPAATAARHGVEAVAWSDWPAIVEALAQADLLVLGGGGIFFDYWGFDPRRLVENEAPDLAHYASFPLLAWLLGKPLMLWACGVGPLRTEEARAAVRATFGLATRASVRDRESHQLLLELGVPPGKVAVTADPAFGLAAPAAAEAAELLGARGVSLQRPLVAVAPRPWSEGVDEEAWQTTLTAALSALHRTTDTQILLLPFHVGYDDPVAFRLQELLGKAGVRQGDVHVIAGDRTPEETLGVIGACDLVVAMRLHSLVFSMLAGTAAVALAYDPKVRQLARQTGHEELCRDLDTPSDLTDLLQATWQRRAAIGADFRAAADELRRRNEQNVELASAALAETDSLPLDHVDQETLRRLAAGAIRGRLGELAGRDRLLREKDALIERQWQDMETATGWLRSQEQSNRELRSELVATSDLLAGKEEALAVAQTELADSREELSRHQEETRQRLELLLRERADVERRLAAIEDTLAFRFVRRFWATLRRLLPEGSRRRRLYTRWRARFAAATTRQPAPMAAEASTSGSEPLPSAATPERAVRPDPWLELLRLEEQVRSRGQGRVVVMVSGTQLVESEGQRPTRLTLALARQGVPVIFVYWRWHLDEWHVHDRVEDGVAQLPLDLLVGAPRRLVSAFAGLDRTMLFEFPHPDVFELLAAANGAGWTTAYDVLDDWQEFHRVGQAIWYDEPFERHLVRACDAVFAVNPVLAERVRALGGEQVEVVGNGLHADIATIHQERPLTRGEVTIGYFGYLAAAWYDWDLLLGAARRRPTWLFYLIGYGGSPERADPPSNVIFLGRQPQHELAAFAANWDVAVVPFKPDPLAAGADPIKIYEYLAMGLPVVTTGVYPPAGAEAFVSRVTGLDAFLAAIEEAFRRGAAQRAAGRAFARSCTWEARIGLLFDSLDRGRQRVAEKRALSGRET